MQTAEDLLTMYGVSSLGASPVADSVEPAYTHITLSLGSGSRTYILRPVGPGIATGSSNPKAVAWEIRLETWNGLKYKQSQGIRIIAESGQVLIQNVPHWLGNQLPYGAVSEELEGRQPVRLARYGADSHAAAEEAFSMVGKLAVCPDFAEFVSHAEAEFTGKRVL